jgi:CRISPR/Cas system endoribonuclease Cas6 (RAMP superfamily)
MKMSTITIHLKDKDEEKFMENLLKKMKITFEKSDEDDFVLTDEMKKVIDERMKEDRTQAVDAWESLKKIRAKYGL